MAAISLHSSIRRTAVIESDIINDMVFRTPIKRLLVNAIGAFFYMLSAVSWMWAILPFLPKLLQLAAWLQPAVQPTPTTVGPSLQAPSLVTTIAVSVVVVIMVGVTVSILVKLPATVGRTGHKLTKHTAEHIIPVITHHSVLSAKKRRLLTARIMAYGKVTLALLPVVVAACSIFVTLSLPYSLVMLIAASLGLLAMLVFALQLLMARLLHVPLEHIW